MIIGIIIDENLLTTTLIFLGHVHFCADSGRMQTLQENNHRQKNTPIN